VLLAQRYSHIMGFRIYRVLTRVLAPLRSAPLCNSSLFFSGQNLLPVVEPEEASAAMVGSRYLREEGRNFALATKVQVSDSFECQNPIRNQSGVRRHDWKRCLMSSFRITVTPVTRDTTCFRNSFKSGPEIADSIHSSWDWNFAVFIRSIPGSISRSNTFRTYR
jgi:hypothetical protein